MTTAGGTSATSAADLFTYDAGPAVTAIAPTPVPLAGGTVVTVTGSGFTAGSTVAFGSTAGTSVSVTNATTLRRHLAGRVGRSRQRDRHHPGGTSATSAADLFTYDAIPTVTAIAPNAGPAGRRHRGHGHRLRLHRRLHGRLRFGGRPLGHRHQRHHPDRHLSGSLGRRGQRDRHHRRGHQRHLGL